MLISLLMFPTAQEEDLLFSNSYVYIKDKNTYKKTEKLCIFSKKEMEDKNFQGLVQSKKYQNAMKILCFKNNKFIITKFFCVRCLRVRSCDGGNLCRHYQGNCFSETPHSTKENIYMILLFCINHYVPLSALCSNDGKEVFPNFPSYPTVLSMINDIKLKVQQNIKEEIANTKKVTIECDGWSHPRGVRMLGVVLRYSLGNSVIETPVELIETPDYTLGSEEMSQMIKQTMKKLQIERKKWLSVASDGAKDMEKISILLDIEWDRCIIHLLHLMIKDFWNKAVERLQKVHAIATIMHSNSNWNEYMFHHGHEYENLGKKRNFTIGSDTRWATHLIEIKELARFEKPILNFQKIKWENKHILKRYVPNPDKEILESDFVMISEIVPLFETITENFKILESKEIYLSKMLITICFIQDEIYNFTIKHNDGCWHDNCCSLIDSINSEIFYNDNIFTKNLKASVILDPNITEIPTQINCQLDDILNYIRNKIGQKTSSTNSPIIQNQTQELDPVEKKYCKPKEINYDDEVKHWFEKVRPFERRCDNPFHYWNEHTGHKHLKKFAKSLFVHAGSSVACERFFSLCANMADDKRSSMTMEHFSALCIVKANIERARNICLNEYCDMN
ncbi:hypothetical protein M9Y10_031873 [Tritrichomonas musculus]|uniref:HAT C-terminal dimerisation domain-containing protein n=1 Tax=Tritrichomonas musculus TaxID=1915356 RepID=A0ABR2GZY6_9EUKA